MANLLTLPPELRLRIYEFAMSDEPHRVNLVQFNRFKELPRPKTATHLAEFDKTLSREMIPLYWSHKICQVFRTTAPGSYFAGNAAMEDRLYHTWLNLYVRDSVCHIRKLEFHVVPTGSVHEDEHEDGCIWRLDLDLGRGHAVFWDRAGNECDCTHAGFLLRRIGEIFASMQQVHGRLRATLGDLWDLYECWYLYHHVQKQIRSWEQCQRQYYDDRLPGMTLDLGWTDSETSISSQA